MYAWDIASVHYFCRTLVQLSIDALCLPVHLLRSTVQDLCDFLSRWQNFAVEYEQSCLESQKQSESAVHKTDRGNNCSPGIFAHPSQFDQAFFITDKCYGKTSGNLVYPRNVFHIAGE